MIPTRVSGNAPQNRRAPNGARSLGILGGMGPLATARFYENLIRQTVATGDQDHVRVYISADPTIPDRTAFIDGNGPDPLPQIISEAEKLVSLGVDLIVMPCNSANVFYSQLSAAISTPILDWVQLAVQEVVDRGVEVVGIAATRGTLMSGIYQTALEAAGVVVVTPSERDVEVIMSVIYGPEGVKSVGSATRDAIEQLDGVVRRLEDGGAQSTLLACTELPIVTTHPQWPGPDQLIDPADVAVARCLELLSTPAMGTLR